ncbi:MAG: TRAP transporter substrate-binding protein, partial [Bacteroides sp.]|nr:TRAP transporter substrate-binding protein [Bacteroides sp.]
AADESVEVERKLWAESEKESLRIVQEAGVTINYPEKEPFAQKVEALLHSYDDNELIYDLITRIKAVE